MNQEEKMISTSELKTGDIILCLGNDKGKVSKGIKRVTGSDYTHAAICLDKYRAAESSISGVQKTRIKDIIDGYDHIAILRQPDAWSEDKVKSVNLFVDKVIESKAKYNISGIFKFVHKKKSHKTDLYNKLKAYFDGKLTPDCFEKGRYFCSELVVDCFIATGFIMPSAAILYKSDTFSPGDLSDDPTFGTFLGYISSKQNYIIPANDKFFNTTTYKEIFE